jgi:hypothetical protein
MHRFCRLSASATLLAALADIAGLQESSATVRPESRIAAWVLAGIVYGLAAAGLYSQAQRRPARPQPAASDETADPTPTP